MTCVQKEGLYDKSIFAARLIRYSAAFARFGVLRWRKGCHKIQNFLQQYQADSPVQFHAISGDASFRRYFRVQNDAEHWVLMDAPPALEDSQRFIAVANALAAAGLQVPAVLTSDPAAGLVLLQDLGDDLLQFSLNAQNAADWYRQALRLLPLMQTVTATAQGPLPQFDRAFCVA